MQPVEELSQGRPVQQAASPGQAGRLWSTGARALAAAPSAATVTTVLFQRRLWQGVTKPWAHQPRSAEEKQRAPWALWVWHGVPCAPCSGAGLCTSNVYSTACVNYSCPNTAHLVIPAGPSEAANRLAVPAIPLRTV